MLNRAILILCLLGPAAVVANDRCEGLLKSESPVLSPPMQEWSKGNVRGAIRFLVSENLKVGWSALTGEGAGHLNRRLSHYLGKQVTGLALYNAGKRLHGDWKLALADASAEAPRQELPKFWNEQRIRTSILALQDAKLPLYRGHIQKDPTGEIQKLLTRIHDRKITGLALTAAGISHFGSWDKTLRQAGGFSEAINGNTFWTREKILSGMRELSRKKLPTSSSAVFADESDLVVSILSRLYQRRVTGIAFYDAATRLFGGWPAARSAAGIEGPAGPSNLFWVKGRVLMGIRALHSQNLSLTAKDLREDPEQRAEFILSRIFGRKTTGLSLYSAASYGFGNWANALRASGIPVAWTERVDWEQKLILGAIRELSRHGFELSFKNVSDDPTRFGREILSNYLGQTVSTRSLLRAARIQFGSWVSATRSAGALFRSPHRAGFGHFVPWQVVYEWTTSTDGRSRPEGQIVLGQVPLSPVDELLKREEEELWKRLVVRKGPLLAALLRILADDESQSAEVWREKLELEMGHQVEIGEIQEMLGTLSEDEDLLELYEMQN